ncbi:hypothetical protein LCGC14_2822220, partial [marine sediment metagenome]
MSNNKWGGYSIDDIGMIDTARFKLASSRSQVWHGPCPFCGGKDRFSIKLLQNRYFCG